MTTGLISLMLMWGAQSMIALDPTPCPNAPSAHQPAAAPSPEPAAPRPPCDVPCREGKPLAGAPKAEGCGCGGQCSCCAACRSGGPCRCPDPCGCCDGARCRDGRGGEMQHQARTRGASPCADKECARGGCNDCRCGSDCAQGRSARAGGCPDARCAESGCRDCRCEDCPRAPRRHDGPAPCGKGCGAGDNRRCAQPGSGCGCGGGPCDGRCDGRCGGNCAKQAGNAPRCGAMGCCGDASCCQGEKGIAKRGCRPGCDGDCQAAGADRRVQRNAPCTPSCDRGACGCGGDRAAGPCGCDGAPQRQANAGCGCSGPCAPCGDPTCGCGAKNVRRDREPPMHEPAPNPMPRNRRAAIEPPFPREQAE